MTKGTEGGGKETLTRRIRDIAGKDPDPTVLAPSSANSFPLPSDGGDPGPGGELTHNDLPDRDEADCHPASSITNTPAGQVAATEVQAAIDELDSEKLARDGSQAMTGDLDMGTNQINDVVDPTLDQDAATKKYVDDSIAGAVSPLFGNSTLDVEISADTYLTTNKYYRNLTVKSGYKLYVDYQTFNGPMAIFVDGILTIESGAYIVASGWDGQDGFDAVNEVGGIGGIPAATLDGYLCGRLAGGGGGNGPNGDGGSGSVGAVGGAGTDKTNCYFKTSDAAGVQGGAGGASGTPTAGGAAGAAGTGTPVAATAGGSTTENQPKTMNNFTLWRVFPLSANPELLRIAASSSGGGSGGAGGGSGTGTGGGGGGGGCAGQNGGGLLLCARKVVNNGTIESKGGVGGDGGKGGDGQTPGIGDTGDGGGGGGGGGGGHGGLVAIICKEFSGNNPVVTGGAGGTGGVGGAAGSEGGTAGSNGSNGTAGKDGEYIILDMAA